MKKFFEETKGIFLVVLMFYIINHFLFYSNLNEFIKYSMVSVMILICCLSLSSVKLLDKIYFSKWGFHLSIVSAYCLLKFGIFIALGKLSTIQV